MADAPSPFPWKRNLAVLWVAQVVTVLGFTFTFPFFPLFFQSLGVEDPARAAFLTGVSGWMLGIGLVIFSPIWGIVGDRYGRKLNVVRATLGGAIVLALAGFSQTTGQLLASRFFAGIFGGVSSTIFAFAAAGTPRRHLGFSLGAVQSAMFFGTIFGPVVGGLIFDAYGMRAAFLSTGAGIFIAAMLVFFFTRDNFQRPATPLKSPVQPLRDLWRVASSRELWPLLAIAFMVHASSLVVFPVLPLLAVELRADTASAATAGGVVFAAMGVTSALSAVSMGWLAGRVGLRPVFTVVAVAAALAYIAPFFAGSIATLAMAMALVGLFQGGLAGVLNGLIAVTSPPEQHGAVFGAANSVQAMGIGIGPLLGGSFAVWFGLRSVFFVNTAMFAVTAVLALVLLRTTLGVLRTPEASEA